MKLKAVLYLCVLFLLGCYESTEGCLDPFGVNYSYEADEECDDCCQYPAVQIRVKNYNGEAFVSPGDTLSDVNGRPYRYLNYSLLVHGFEWQGVDTSFQVLERTAIQQDDTTMQSVDDFIVLEGSKYSHTIGSMRCEGAIKKIAFSVGLGKDAGFLSNTHKVHTLRDTSGMGYHYYSMRRIIHDIVNDDTLTCYSHLETNSMAFEWDTILQRKQNIALDVDMQHRLWLDMVDVSTFQKDGDSLPVPTITIIN